MSMTGEVSTPSSPSCGEDVWGRGGARGGGGEGEGREREGRRGGVKYVVW